MCHVSPSYCTGEVGSSLSAQKLVPGYYMACKILKKGKQFTNMKGFWWCFENLGTLVATL
jgi:hypothetical protein